MRAFKAHNRPARAIRFEFSRQWVAVSNLFYVHDRDWGPAFVKIGTYLPYPVKLSQRPRMGETTPSTPTHPV
jgi:hypothetical protein